MKDDISQKAKHISKLYFNGVQDERPYELWQAFDPELARDMSLFFTGQMYARERIPHTTRQLAAVSALTALSRQEELKLHIIAAFNVGCTTEEIAEVIFQTAPYAGVPAINAALKTLRAVLQEKGKWPPEHGKGETPEK